MNDDASNNTVIDSSGNGRNGALSDSSGNINTSTISCYGAVGKAFQFDISDERRVIATGYKGVAGTGARTLACWWKENGTDDYQDIFEYGTDAAGARWTCSVNPDGKIMIGISSGNWVGSTNVCDGKWHHIVFVFPDGETNVNKHLLYVDGVLETGCSGISYAMNTGSTNDCYIGYPGTAGTKIANGKIDDLRFYSRDLDVDEIADLFDEKNYTTTTTTVGPTTTTTVGPTTTTTAASTTSTTTAAPTTSTTTEEPIEDPLDQNTYFLDSSGARFPKSEDVVPITDPWHDNWVIWKSAAGVRVKNDVDWFRGTLISRWIQEGYSAGGVSTEFEEGYALQAVVENIIEENYSMVSNVNKTVSESYGILNHNVIGTVVEEIYSVINNPTEILNSQITAKVNGVRVRLTSFSITADEQSYMMSFRAEAADYTSWLRCTEEKELVFKIAGDVYNFILDNPSRTRAFGEQTFSIGGRSKTKRLDFPYATPVTKVWAATTAKTICQELCDAEGIILNWNITDWQLRNKVVEANEDSPINIISNMLKDQAVVLSSKTGELIVQYIHPVSPTVYAEQTPAIIFSDINDILSLSEEKEGRPGYNMVVVSDKELTAEEETYFIIELDEIRNEGREVFNSYDTTIYLRIYTNIEYSIQMTSGTAQKIASHETLDVPSEVYSFIKNDYPAASKPVHSIEEYSWYGNDLGTISLVENSFTKLSASLATEDTLGVAKMTYKTFYDVWKIVPPSLTTPYKILIYGEETSS